jgi:hypothetical protein
MFHSLKPLESHATSNLYNNQKKLIMSTFNPHSLALAGFFQIVCLQELLLLPNFLISTTEPSSHFQHFCCSFNLPCRLLMNYCLSFFNVVSLPFNSSLHFILLSMLWTQSYCSSFHHAIMTMVIHRKYFLELNNSIYISPKFLGFLVSFCNLKNIKNNGGSWANMSLSVITRNITSQIRRLLLSTLE